MRAKDIMTNDPVCCTPESNLEEVALKMCRQNCGEIPIVESEETMIPIGVITDRDIVCRTLAQGKNPLEMSAVECMTVTCITVTPETSLEECCALLEKHQIRRLVVVDRLGRCCGIVSQADIARHAPHEKTAEILQEISQP